MKWTLNYDTGDYEWMDKNGYSYDTGEYSYNFDKSPFEEEERSSSSLWDDEDDN